MAREKKRLTPDQEFEVMKLVLDKFLWLGFIVMAFGMYKLAVEGLDALTASIAIMVAGAVILVLFLIIIIKEYEIIK